MLDYKETTTDDSTESKAEETLDGKTDAGAEHEEETSPINDDSKESKESEVSSSELMHRKLLSACQQSHTLQLQAEVDQLDRLCTNDESFLQLDGVTL